MLPGAAAAEIAAPAARAALLPQLETQAVAQNVPPSLADAVAMVETGYTVNALGAAGEVGMMQILPATAAQMGFRGAPAALFAPAANMRFAVAYLARAWAASGGNVCRALMKYRAGVAEERYSPLSLAYCRRAAAWLAATGSPLAASAQASIPAFADMPDRPGAGTLRLVDLSALPALAGMPDLALAPRTARADAQAAVDAALAE